MTRHEHNTAVYLPQRRWLRPPPRRHMAQFAARPALEVPRPCWCGVVSNRSWWMRLGTVVVEHECVTVTPLTAGWHRVDQAAMPPSSRPRTKGETRGTQQTFYLPGGTDENSGAKTAGRRGQWMVVA